MSEEIDFTNESTISSTEAKLAFLKQEKNKFRSEENYVEAQSISRKIEALNVEYKKQLVSQLKNSQNNERELVQDSFFTEFSELEEYWENLHAAFVVRCDKEINSMLIKHAKKVKSKRKALENEIMVNFKPSPSLLNMIKCKENAVRQEKFSDAQGLLVQIEQIKADEEFRYAELKKNTIEQHIANYNAAFEKKMQNLKKRQQTGLDELTIQKNEEYSRIVKKYENLRRGLENSQQIRVNIQEGKHTTVAGRHSNSPNKVMQSTLSPFRQKSLKKKQSV